MSRKAIIWIVIGVLALAFVAALGLALVRQSSSVVISKVAPGVPSPPARVFPGSLVGPLGQLRIGDVVVGAGGGAFRGLALVLALLVAGAIGALIVYLVGPGGRPDAVAATGPAPAAPTDPQYQQFLQWQQWQQFEQWHRKMHAAARPKNRPCQCRKLRRRPCRPSRRAICRLQQIQPQPDETNPPIPPQAETQVSEPTTPDEPTET